MILILAFDLDPDPDPDLDPDLSFCYSQTNHDQSLLPRGDWRVEDDEHGECRLKIQSVTFMQH